MCEVGNMVRINVGSGHGDEALSTDFSRVWYTSKNDLSSQEPYLQEESKKGQL